MFRVLPYFLEKARRSLILFLMGLTPGFDSRSEAPSTIDIMSPLDPPEIERLRPPLTMLVTPPMMTASPANCRALIKTDFRRRSPSSRARASSQAAYALMLATSRSAGAIRLTVW
jgi:hypothetical protein